MEIQEKDPLPYIAVIKFADVEIPCFKEVKGKDYIQYGDDNMYPQYLTRLFNKSAKHNAILVGKAKYIFGGGFSNGDAKINRLGESLNDISPRLILDECIYGGWYVEIVWNRFGKIDSVYHVGYNTIRADKNGGYLFCSDWKKFTRESDWKHIDDFDPKNPVGSQIYCYHAYRPGQDYYPLPDYVGAINYIEVDIEIGKFNLSGIKNGLNPSKVIQFFSGEPTTDKKREITRGLNREFAGSENAGKAMIIYNKSNDSRAAEISDLSSSDIDKMYDLLNKTAQQEIYSGHLITSPSLFGIKTEGQLGGTTELNISYSIFQNTYAKPKAQTFEKEIEYLFSYSNFPGEYELLPTDPVDVVIDPHDVINSMPKEYVFRKLNIPEEMWNSENVGADNRPTPTIPVAPNTELESDPALINPNLKHLTAKQLQNINRIIRQYKKGQIDAGMARIALQRGYALSDAEVDEFLGIQPKLFSAQGEDDYIIGMFDACGESKDDYEILKSKPVAFSNIDQAEEDEDAFKASFKTGELSPTEAKIIDLIKKDPLITADVIAITIGQTKAYVESKLDSLVQRGYITQTENVIGTDIQIERAILPDLEVPPVVIDKVPITKISIMYSYEVKPGIGPAIIETTRPFCQRMIELKRLYSRFDIERISLRLGYSVFDRKGGWWGKSPECRHRWESKITIKKS